MKYDLITKIKNKMIELSKGKKKLAKFILLNYDKVIFNNVSQLADMAGVSESTVLRFVSELGFNGYSSFKRELEYIARENLTSKQRMNMSLEKIDRSDKDILTNILEKDAESIKDTLNSIDKDEFENIVETILNAKKVYILGVRSSYSIASFLSFYLNIILDNIVFVNYSTAAEVFEQIFRVKEGDVFIAISFPRYSKRTIKAIEYAYSKNASTIAITDSETSPLIRFSTNKLIVKSEMASFMDSLVAPLSIINALLVAISVNKNIEISETLESLENIWGEHEVYSNNENKIYFD